ncbi:MAG: hypothetical protein K2Y23_06845 [Cyanobacteria bacterium]|nr:hypothetical protein [Cyanobacteriota bacterium]
MSSATRKLEIRSSNVFATVIIVMVFLPVFGLGADSSCAAHTINHTALTCRPCVSLTPP